MRIDLGATCCTQKILVLSDLHIGDPRVNGDTLHCMWKTVQAESPDLLVLNGDVLEGNLASAEHKAKLKSICALAEHVVVLQGNHDTKATQEFAASVNAKFGTQLTGISGEASFAIEHGNRFDTAWHKVPGLGRIAIWLNRMVYRVTGFDFQEWVRTFPSVHKKLLQQHNKAAKAWIGKDIVITGHTHLPTNDPFGVGYFNSGDWVYHKTYVVIENGIAKLTSVIGGM